MPENVQQYQSWTENSADVSFYIIDLGTFVGDPPERHRVGLHPVPRDEVGRLGQEAQREVEPGQDTGAERPEDHRTAGVVEPVGGGVDQVSAAEADDHGQQRGRARAQQDGRLEDVRRHQSDRPIIRHLDPAPVPPHISEAPPHGTRQLLEQLGPEKFAEWTGKQKRLLLTEPNVLPTVTGEASTTPSAATVTPPLSRK